MASNIHKIKFDNKLRGVTLAGEETLSISVGDGIKAEERFGNTVKKRVISGVAGTLQLTNEADTDKIVSMAIDLSKNTKRPVVIVVRL